MWVHRWNAGLMSFRVRRNPAYRFLPGQFARIGIRKQDGEVIWRAYSIVSAPHELFLEFFMVILPGGEFSSRVGAFNIGDTLLVEQMPQGFLTADRFRQPDRAQDLWLIGTGTGLAPYISMLRDETVWQRFEHIVLYCRCVNATIWAIPKNWNNWRSRTLAMGWRNFTSSKRSPAIPCTVPCTVG